jgi:hypothetical protein
MFSAEKEIQDNAQHPLAGTLPRAMPLPLEVTPWLISYEDLQGYYVFEKETTATTGTYFPRSGKPTDRGGSYTGRFLAVRGERSLQRNFQTAWAGTLLAWTEKNMTIVEQGQLPGSAAGWKHLERLMLRGEHFSKSDCAAAFSAMRYLSCLKVVFITLDGLYQEIPEQFYRLSQLKKLHVRNTYTGRTSEDRKWSITHISPDIANMTSLEDISFRSQMELTVVPDAIFDLPNLTNLRFVGCWNLVLSKHQVQRICELVEAGVYVNLSALNLRLESDRIKLLEAVEENGGEIDWPGMSRLNREKLEDTQG